MIPEDIRADILARLRRADLAPLKKYFYVLRPLLAVRWLELTARPRPSSAAGC